MLTKAVYNCVRICGCTQSFARQVSDLKFRCYSSASSSGSNSDGSSKRPEEDDGSKQKKVGETNATKEKKKPNVVDILGDKLLDAVSDVAANMHKDNADLRKRTKSELIAKLTQHEKETFDAASASQASEMLSDSSIVDLLADVSAQKPKLASRAAEIRHARRGLVLLRREIFYQATQSGYRASQAYEIAERAVEIAEARAIAKSKRESGERIAELEKAATEAAQRDEREKRLYDYAFRMAEKMLYSGTALAGRGGQVRKVIYPDAEIENLFTSDGADLGVFEKDMSGLREHELDFWSELDAKATRVWNQSFGPKNGFEEMIELTKKGKMWPYPINNEYLLGEEEKVGFHEHVFLQKELAQHKLPTSGPVAHFMELVCVGLSKNSFMTIQKKRDHLKWFANYFNEKKVEEVHRLHKQEQDALAEA